MEREWGRERGGNGGGGGRDWGSERESKKHVCMHPYTVKQTYIQGVEAAVVYASVCVRVYMCVC